jgi:hypothetical protein
VRSRAAVATTWIPACASPRRTIARPSPRPPPVTMATRLRVWLVFTSGSIDLHSADSIADGVWPAASYRNIPLAGKGLSPTRYTLPPAGPRMYRCARLSPSGPLFFTYLAKQPSA